MVHTHRGCGAIQASSPAYIKMSEQWLGISSGKYIPISLLFGCPLRRGPQNRAMDTEFGLLPTTNWDPSGAIFQPHILGHRKEKKPRMLEKNPHNVTNTFGDWLNEQFCHLQTCFTLQIYFMLLIFQVWGLSGSKQMLHQNFSKTAIPILGLG